MKPRDIIGIGLLIGLIPGASGMGETTSDFTVLLPDEIRGWKAATEDRIYTRDTLYDYIDGGAELYLSYGFRKAVSRTYSKSGQPDIVVDLFDMETSRDAFGVFSHARETVDETFGQGAQYTEGMLLFWKDRYFISILAYPETVESKSAILDLSGKIEAAIPGEGPLPDILSLLQIVDLQVALVVPSVGAGDLLRIEDYVSFPWVPGREHPSATKTPRCEE